MSNFAKLCTGMPGHCWPAFTLSEVQLLSLLYFQVTLHEMSAGAQVLAAGSTDSEKFLATY